MKLLLVEVKAAINANIDMHKQQWINQYKGYTTMNVNNQLHAEDQVISDKVWSDHREMLLSRKDSKKKTDFHVEYNDVNFDESKADASLEIERTRIARTLGAHKALADKKRDEELKQQAAAEDMDWLKAKLIITLIGAIILAILITLYKLTLGAN